MSMSKRLTNRYENGFDSVFAFAFGSWNKSDDTAAGYAWSSAAAASVYADRLTEVGLFVIRLLNNDTSGSTHEGDGGIAY